jgi:nitrogen fixation protein FixH
MVGTSIALTIIIPFSLPISVALTSCSTILRSKSGLIVKNQQTFRN